MLTIYIFLNSFYICKANVTHIFKKLTVMLLIAPFHLVLLNLSFKNKYTLSLRLGNT